MRMPTLLPFGEGCTSGEAIDTRTRSIRRGSGHSTSEGWFVVIGGDPLRVRVAASTSLEAAATAGLTSTLVVEFLSRSAVSGCGGVEESGLAARARCLGFLAGVAAVSRPC